MPTSPLLATKLFIPQRRQQLVDRPELVARLDAALHCPLMLVSAPAGFGKTTLVAGWARGLALPAAWLTLDAADNDPARFLFYLLAAMRQAVPTLGDTLWAALQGGGGPPLEAAMAVVVNEVAAVETEFVLVLDDLHLVEAPAIHAALQGLVAHQPPQLHLVLLTREDPQLPLARLRARGELAEVRAQALRFNPQETTAFLQEVMHLPLDPATIAQVDLRVEGWVAGLQLAALSMQNRTDPGEVIAGLSGSHHFVLGYLTEEVLHGLPAETETFLLETAILPQLSGPLCDAVTESSGSTARLEQLYASNLFVTPLDDEHRWYRYHHLFGDLLRSQLQRRWPARVALLHARASAWHEAQGEAGAAIEHTFAAEDYGRAVQLLERYGRQVVLQGHAQTVERWLRRLPAGWQAAGPRANLAFAWSLLLRGRPDETDLYLRHAEAAAESQQQAGRMADAAATAAEALALRAGVAALQGDTARGGRLAEAAVGLAPEADVYARSMTLFCLGTAYNYDGRTVQAIARYREALPLCREAGNAMAAMLIASNLAVLYMARGQLNAAAELCRETIARTGDDGAPSPAVATVLGAYSQLLYEWGDLEAAERQAVQALTLSRLGGHVAAIAYGCVILARIVQAQGEPARAPALLREAQALAGRGMPAWVAPHLVAEEVRLALLQGDVVGAEAALARSGVSVDEATSQTREVVHMAYLRTSLWAGRLACQPERLRQALILAGRILASAQPADRMGRVLETLILRCQVHHALGNLAAARADLRGALTLGESEGYVRVFVEEGEALRPLLAALRAEASAQHAFADLVTSAAYLDRLLAELPPGGEPAPVRRQAAVPPAPTAALVEPLTERELEVLRLMAAGHTYEEAAEQLVVSLNTVRFHIKGIYGKLGVDRRAAAVARAQALGLL